MEMPLMVAIGTMGAGVMLPVTGLPAAVRSSTDTCHFRAHGHVDSLAPAFASVSTSFASGWRVVAADISHHSDSTRLASSATSGLSLLNSSSDNIGGCGAT
ncbi:hypothetical protein V8C86DRAFT_2550769, partial [Haematococcus lacustris]